MVGGGVSGVLRSLSTKVFRIEVELGARGGVGVQVDIEVEIEVKIVLSVVTIKLVVKGIAVGVLSPRAHTTTSIKESKRNQYHELTNLGPYTKRVHMYYYRGSRPN